MPEGRLIKRKIIDDPRVQTLPEGATLLYYNIILTCDKESRLVADPQWLNKKLCAYRDYTNEQIKEWLQEMHGRKKNGHGLIELYKVNGVAYLWLPGFAGEQSDKWAKSREATSYIPEPPDGDGQVSPLAFPPQIEETKAEDDPKVELMLEHFEEAVGRPATPMEYEDIKDFSTEYEDGWFEKALAEYPGKPLTYIDKVMKGWKEKGGPDGGTGKNRHHTQKSVALRDETNTEL